MCVSFPAVSHLFPLWCYSCFSLVGLERVAPPVFEPVPNTAPVPYSEILSLSFCSSANDMSMTSFFVVSFSHFLRFAFCNPPPCCEDFPCFPFFFSSRLLHSKTCVTTSLPRRLSPKKRKSLFRCVPPGQSFMSAFFLHLHPCLRVSRLLLCHGFFSIFSFVLVSYFFPVFPPFAQLSLVTSLFSTVIRQRSDDRCYLL